MQYTRACRHAWYSLGVRSLEGSVYPASSMGLALFPVNLLKLHVYVTVPMYVCLSIT